MMASMKTPPSTTVTTVTAQRSRYGTSFSRSPPVTRRLRSHAPVGLCASVSGRPSSPSPGLARTGFSRGRVRRLCTARASTLRRNPV